MSKTHRARPPYSRNAAPVDLAQARRLCERRPEDAGAWQTLGNLLLSADPQQALSSFEQALHLRPDDPQALELVAKAAQKLGDAERAENLANRALDLAPGFVPAHHRLATLHLSLIHI